MEVPKGSENYLGLKRMLAGRGIGRRPRRRADTIHNIPSSTLAKYRRQANKIQTLDRIGVRKARPGHRLCSTRNGVAPRVR